MTTFKTVNKNFLPISKKASLIQLLYEKENLALRIIVNLMHARLNVDWKHDQ